MENLAYNDILPVVPSSPSTEAHLGQCNRIALAIQTLTHAAIRDLRVESNGQKVILTGECSTFYLKQLAQEAALPLAGGLLIHNEIVVRHALPR
ncbi:MAG: BON domain-containing protein [Pirellulales bacterium]|nr:BON domain-containing protein [Pirellulales bacterium]